MDEEKATAYYDEMRRKGGGAAKLKQGLGYAAPSSPPPQASSSRSFPSFVKGDDHSESLAKHEKESRLAVVRDKLKKRSVEDDDADGHGDRHYQEQTSKRAHGYGHLAKGRHRSRSQDRVHTERRERSHPRRWRESRSSSSCSREHRSRSHSSSSDSNYRKGTRHSRERSIEKREKRSRESLRRARKTSRSPRKSSRRSRSSSPRAHSSDNRRHSDRDSRHLSHRSRSPYAERQRKNETRKDDTHSARKPNACDYSKVIAGYDNMTPAEKVKEKMKLQLSETVSKDTARGMDIEWERFAFNKNAPLDDDAKLDYFGDGTGAQDDTGFLQNTGSTFLSTCSQAKREAQIQAAHDTAIFGPFTGLSSKKTGSYKKESHDSPTKETTTDDDAVVQSEGPPPLNSLLSDQVLTFQQGSWRERALKLKQQRASGTIT